MRAPLPHAATAPSTTADQLRHVRWLAGGTGSGKSTVTAVLAQRFDLDIYSGDRAEHDWLTRCSPQRHPHLAALSDPRPGDNWRDRSPQSHRARGLLRGASTRPLPAAELAHPSRVPPAHAGHFRRTALTRHYADPDRARANWGNLDAAKVLETRLERDALWDAEVTEQANALGLSRRTIDGTRRPEELAEGFTLTAAPN